ncbi:MAG: tetratricopeptide repeat protein, partial [Anaerolineae bacterium]
SPAELLARLHGPWLLSMDGLRDVSPRQKTLRSAIGWSYGLLTPTEQTLFIRLAVFVGGCTLAAAELLCGDDAALSPSLPFSLSPPQVLDGIASLLDKSLLRRETGLHGEPRYIMLETVREFGLERVALSGQEAALRARHVSCLLRLIEHAEQAELNIFPVQLRRVIDDEIHNMRAALAWATEYNAQVALLLTAALVNWLCGRGPQMEGRLLIESILALPGASAHTIPRVRVLNEAGLLLLAATNETDRSQAFEEESLAISQELGYRKGEAKALLGLGRIAQLDWCDLIEAQHCFEKALVIYRELDDLRGISHATVFLGQIAAERADLSQARALAEECLTIARQAGIENPYALVLLAEFARNHGDLERTRWLLEQAVADLDAYGSIADVLEGLGSVATRQGDFAAAHAFLDESLSLWKKLGNERALAASLPMAVLVQAEGNYRGAIGLYRAGLPGIKLYRNPKCPCGLGLAELATVFDQHEVTARLLGAIHSVDEALHQLAGYERDDYNRLAGVARASLGAAPFDAAWTQGRTSPFEAVIEEAVSTLEGVLRVDDQPLSA